jgi:hypothetical protein
MKYRQELSFIATLTSQTPGFEGIIDSVEYASGQVISSRGDWLTLTVDSNLKQQQFWFGCFEEGGKLRFRIKTFTPDQDLNLHHKILALSHNAYVGLYPAKKSTEALWILRSPGGLFDMPTVGRHQGIIVTTLDQRAWGPSQGRSARDPLSNCYVRIAAKPLVLSLGVERTGVPLFDSFASDALPSLYR